MAQIWWILTALAVVVIAISGFYAKIFENSEAEAKIERLKLDPKDKIEERAVPPHVKRIPVYTLGVWLLITIIMLISWLFFGGIEIGPVRVSEILKVSALLYADTMFQIIVIPLIFFVAVMVFFKWIAGLIFGKF